MKKILSLVLVLVLMMSIAVTASAADGSFTTGGTETILPSTGSTPSLNDVFMAISDFFKLEAFVPYFDGFHEALGDFYIQFDLWLRVIGVTLNDVIGNLLNSGVLG